MPLSYFTLSYTHKSMSTTWVFLGLLAGRELAMSLRHTSGCLTAAVKMGANDAFKAAVDGPFIYCRTGL